MVDRLVVGGVVDRLVLGACGGQIGVGGVWWTDWC